MKTIFWKLSLMGMLAWLAFVPRPALAHGDEDHGAAPAAVSTSGIPETQFELQVIDTSQNDPLLGGEVPLDKAKVRATFLRDGKEAFAQDAHAEVKSGVYGVHTTFDTNGTYSLKWDVKPETGNPFTVDFPIQVAGVPEKSASFFSGWRLPALIVGGVMALLVMFTLGRVTGNRKNGHVKVAVVLVALSLAGVSTRVLAHGGENDEAPVATAGSTVVDLKVGIGDLTTAKRTETTGKYKTILTLKVLKPRAFDPNRLTLTPEQEKTLGIQTIVVKVQAFETGLSVTGSIQPNPANVVNVASRVPGRIRLITVNVGDRVRAGQILATVESTEVADAQANYTAAQSSGLSLQAALRSTQERVRIAERQLKQQRELAAAGAFSQTPLQEARKEQATANSELATVRAEVATAQSQQAQAQADLASHGKQLERIQELYDAGIRSKAELEANQLEHEQDKARVTQAQNLVEQQTARVTQAQVRITLASQAVSREQKIYKSNVLNRKEIVQAQGALETARLEAQGAQANLAGANRAVTSAAARLGALGVVPGSGNVITLTSPTEGVVTSRNAGPGESVLPDKMLLTILNPAVVWVEGDVFEKDLPRIRVGQSVQITTEAVPGKVFTGTLSFTGATVSSETRAVRVRVAVKNAGNVLRPGMFVKALLVTDARPRTIIVPDTAIQEDGGMKVVYVKEGSAYERREVAVGESVNEHTEIKTGVKSGDLVVTVGGYQLKAIGKK